MTDLAAEQLLHALRRECFTELGRGRNLIRLAWPGSDGRREWLSVLLNGYPKEVAQQRNVVLAELQHAADRGAAARRVLDSLDQAHGDVS